MKIAGVAGGKNRGDIIELSSEKKIMAAVGMGVNKWAETYKDGQYLAFATNVTIAQHTSSPHGNLLKGKWANNHYNAEGTLTLHLRNKAKDCQLEPKAKTYKINFYDGLDPLGLPDVVVDTITIK